MKIISYEINFFKERIIEKKTNQIKNGFQNLIDFQDIRKNYLVID